MCLPPSSPPHSQCRHPNIVQLMAVTVSGSKGVVILEYAEGKQGREAGVEEGGTAAVPREGQAAAHVKAAGSCCSRLRRQTLELAGLMLGMRGLCVAALRPVPTGAPPAAAGRDLHAALDVRAAGTSDRLFSWHRRGKRCALQLARALNYLHSKKFLHLDVKSPNVLLTGAHGVRGGASAPWRHPGASWRLVCGAGFCRGPPWARCYACGRPTAAHPLPALQLRARRGWRTWVSASRS